MRFIEKQCTFVGEFNKSGPGIYIGGRPRTHSEQYGGFNKGEPTRIVNHQVQRLSGTPENRRKRHC